MKRTVTVPCPRWLKSGETRAFEDTDTVYPRSVSERERDATLPKHVGETYQECPGEVTVTISWTRRIDPNDCLNEDPCPPVDEITYGDCSECGVDDWTTAEAKAMTASLPSEN